MYTINYKKKFKKTIKSLKNSNNFIYNTAKKSVERLLDWPPFEKQWNVHNLQGKFNMYLSINVTWDWRIFFTLKETDKKIIIYNIWKHSQFYK